MTEMLTAGSVPTFTLADRLGKALKHGGVSVQQMADHLEVSRNTVGNYINGRGKKDPDKATLMLWAERCGVSYRWLRYGAMTESRCTLQPSGYATSSLVKGLHGPS